MECSKGEGAEAWPPRSCGSCLAPWEFSVLDIEVWADEESMDESALPFEFEYNNQQLNKRITKTFIGGLFPSSMPR